MIRKSDRQKNNKVINITLISSANTGHQYTQTIHKKHLKELNLKKFDPVIKSRVHYKAVKIKASK